MYISYRFYKPGGCGGCGCCWGCCCWFCGCGWFAAWFGVSVGLRLVNTSSRHVGQVCCRWNHDRRQCVWKMWLQGSFLPTTSRSRQMMHVVISRRCSSSSLTSGNLGNKIYQVIFYHFIDGRLFSKFDLDFFVNPPLGDEKV